MPEFSQSFLQLAEAGFGQLMLIEATWELELSCVTVLKLAEAGYKCIMLAEAG